VSFFFSCIHASFLYLTFSCSVCYPCPKKLVCKLCFPYSSLMYTIGPLNSGCNSFASPTYAAEHSWNLKESRALSVKVVHLTQVLGRSTIFLNYKLTIMTHDECFEIGENRGCKEKEWVSSSVYPDDNRTASVLRRPNEHTRHYTPIQILRPLLVASHTRKFMFIQQKLQFLYFSTGG